jgi:DNA-binding transcriptional MocR family regulator
VGVNPATVVRAYDMLADEELIYKKVGSGSFVAPDRKIIKSKNREDMLKHGQIKLAESINFASAAPSTDLFPVEDFKYAINKVLERDQGEAFSYQKSQGFLPLRKSIRKYFTKRGINSSLNQIQVVSGAQQAIDIISKILLDYKDQIIVEDPTYFGALQAFNSRKADIKSVKMEQDGADLEETESYLKENEIKFFFTMQNFQNPTGVNWSRKKQIKLLELAAKYATDISSGGLTQRAFDYYLREGLLDKHISLQRDLFQKRYKLMKNQITEHLPKEIKVTFEITGGLYFWIKLPENRDAQEIYEKAAQKGVVFSPGYLFSINKRYSNYFRLSFAAVDDQQIKRGIRSLRDVYNNFRGTAENYDYSPLL